MVSTKLPMCASRADIASGAQMRVRAEQRAVADDGLVEDAAVANEHSVAERGVLDDGVGADAAVGADARVAEELNEGLDDGVGRDLDRGIDHAGLGAEDRHARGHEASCGGRAHGGVEVHHLGDGVGAEDLVDCRGDGGDDALAFGDEQGGDVGEIELAAGVLVGEALEVGEERGGVEAVDAGVDLGASRRRA